MGKYHYIFTVEQFNTAVSKRQKFLKKNNHAKSAPYLRESKERFIKQERFNTKVFSDEGFLKENLMPVDYNNLTYYEHTRGNDYITPEPPTAKHASFPLYFKNVDSESEADMNKELADENSGLNKYLSSPCVIKNYENDIARFATEKPRHIKTFHDAYNKLHTTKFHRNWFQKHFSIFRFKENRFVKEQWNIIKSSNKEIRKNEIRTEIAKNEIQKEIRFQNKYEKLNKDKLENMRTAYNNYVRKYLKPETDQETYEKLVFKPQFDEMPDTVMDLPQSHYIPGKNHVPNYVSFPQPQPVLIQQPIVSIEQPQATKQPTPTLLPQNN